MGIAADKLIASIDYELWGIGRIHIQFVFKRGLPGAELWGRKWICPPNAIPIIDVLAQDDNGDSRERLLVELREQSIRGRAARAALGREELG